VIEQFQWSENQLRSQQVPDLELQDRPQPVQWTNNELEIQQPSAGNLEIVTHQPGNLSRGVVESVGAIPNELYDRLGLTMPKWLLWLLTVVLGIVFSGLLISTLALWTPLWSNLERTEEELGFSGKDDHKVPLPGELWGNISQYFNYGC
jgi:hypothetical protein